MASATTKDMTHGVPWRLIAGFAIPVFLSQLFQQLYNTADSLIVSNFLGDNALAAVSASGPLIFLLISFFAGAASGVGVAIARYFGAGDYDKVSRTVHTAVLLGLISSLILTVIGVLFTPTLLLWMDTDPEVLPDAIGYFRCYFAGVGAGVMYNTFTGIMNALGDSKRPLYFLIVSSVTNVILDLLFVAVFHWDAMGAALATLASYILVFFVRAVSIRRLLPFPLISRWFPRWASCWFPAQAPLVFLLLILNAKPLLLTAKKLFGARRKGESV